MKQFGFSLLEGFLFVIFGQVLSKSVLTPLMWQYWALWGTLMAMAIIFFVDGRETKENE